VVWGVKNENHGFGKMAGKSKMPPKCCGKSLGAKGIDLGMVGG